MVAQGLLAGGVLAAYLVGSIPFGLLVGRAKGIDVRTSGSGNIGATNVGRLLGLRFFWITFLLDFLKGFIPVILATLLTHHLHGDNWPPLLIAAAAIIGHVFPVYLKFHGGKGVATTLGAVLGIWPIFTIAALAATAAFVIVFFAYRIISLSSITAAIIFPFMVIFLGRYAPHRWLIFASHSWRNLAPLVGASVLFSAMIIIKHRSNIVRLLAGTEKKLAYPAPKPLSENKTPGPGC